MQKKEISFVGIGTTKAASTWIYECLGEHPEIRKASKKEVRFFNNDHHFAKGLDWYYAHFKGFHEGEGLMGEFSPSYIYEEETARRIYKTFPKIKLIAVFRNPIEKLYSLYWYNKIGGRGSFVGFDTFEDVLSGVPDILTNALHGKQLQAYLKIFPREQFQFVTYDDIRKNPKEVMEKIYDFLGIDTTFVASSTQRSINETGDKRIRYPRMFKFIYGTYRHLIKYRFFAVMMQGVNKLYWSNVLRGVGIQEGGERFKKPPMRQETRQRLQEFFKEDTNLLGELIGRDVSHWV